VSHEQSVRQEMVDWSKVGKRSKKKGSDFEREVARKFTAALYPAKDGIVKRVPLSGGWSRSMAYDIVAMKKVKGELRRDDRWDIHVECKIRRYLNLLGMFVGNSDTPLAWYVAALKKAKSPVVLIFRQLYHQGTFFVMGKADWRSFFGELPSEYVEFVSSRLSLTGLSVSKSIGPLIWGNLDEFLRRYKERWENL